MYWIVPVNVLAGYFSFKASNKLKIFKAYNISILFLKSAHQALCFYSTSHYDVPYLGCCVTLLSWSKVQLLQQRAATSTAESTEKDFSG